MACTSFNLRTQRSSNSKGCLVGDAVRVGFVGVRDGVVDVGESVPVALAVGVKGSSVGVHVAEWAGSGVGGGVSGPGLKIKASRMIIPMNAGIAYRDQVGRDNFVFLNGVTVGGSPVYPNALRMLLKLCSYSPTAKFT